MPSAAAMFRRKRLMRYLWDQIVGLIELFSVQWRERRLSVSLILAAPRTLKLRGYPSILDQWVKWQTGGRGFSRVAAALETAA